MKKKKRKITEKQRAALDAGRKKAHEIFKKNRLKKQEKHKK